MSVIDELAQAREELEALLVEVLGSVFGEEAAPVRGQRIPPGPVVSARLAIHDEADGSYTMVEIRTSAIIARVLASRMLLVADPAPDDLLDVVGELGNIAGGNVKSLLRHSCRLSLPTARMSQEPAQVRALDGVTVCSAVLGQVVELAVHAADGVAGLRWPGAASAEVVEAPA